MLTHWKVIAQRVSDNLNIPYEEVEADILKYASTLHKAYREGTSYEYDYFFLGKSVMNSSKLSNYWKNLQKYPDRKNYEFIKRMLAIREKLKGKKTKSKIRSETNKENREKYSKHY